MILKKFLNIYKKTIRFFQKVSLSVNFKVFLFNFYCYEQFIIDDVHIVKKYFVIFLS